MPTKIDATADKPAAAATSSNSTTSGSLPSDSDANQPTKQPLNSASSSDPQHQYSSFQPGQPPQQCYSNQAYQGDQPTTSPPNYTATPSNPPLPGYPAPPGNAQYVQGQNSVTTVIMNQPAMSMGPGLPFYPCQTICPHCQAPVMTTVSNKIGNFAWMVCGAIFLFGLVVCPLLLLGFCFIPLCIPSCKDVVHTCPNCNKVIAIAARRI